MTWGNFLHPYSGSKSLYFLPWRLEHQVPLECGYVPIKLQSILSHKSISRCWQNPIILQAHPSPSGQSISTFTVDLRTQINSFTTVAMSQYKLLTLKIWHFQFIEPISLENLIQVWSCVENCTLVCVTESWTLKHCMNGGFVYCCSVYLTTHEVRDQPYFYKVCCE